jgi:hypothetical protein
MRRYTLAVTAPYIEGLSGHQAYIAGPMRGLPLYNFPAFFTAERRLKPFGVLVFNPARKDIDAGVVTVGYDVNGDLSRVDLTPQFTIEDALRRDYIAICESRNIIFLPGWEDSPGACNEYRVAREVGCVFWKLNRDLSVITHMEPN